MKANFYTGEIGVLIKHTDEGFCDIDLLWQEVILYGFSLV